MKKAYLSVILSALLILGVLITACASNVPPTTNRWPTLTAFVATNQAFWGNEKDSATAISTDQSLATDTTGSVAATPASSRTPVPATIAASPVSTIDADTLAVPAYLPMALRQAIKLPADTKMIEGSSAAVTMSLFAAPAWSQWVYALVAPFPTVTDSILFDELRQAWAGTGSLPGQPLLMDAPTLALLSDLWGAPADGLVKVIDAEKLLDEAWQRRTSWAIIPFERLEPRWKVLAVDGQSPVENDFDRQTYPLTFSFGLLDSNGQALTALPAGWSLPKTNRDPEQMTVLVMTGVTALVRGTSNTMYSKGVLYPAQDIGPWLQQADITHISNEIAFTQDCRKYDTSIVELKFCTNSDYIALLDYVGTDVVELTGDHFVDQSAEAMLFTLGLYRQRGWLFYGGGANLEDGLKAVTITHHGNKFAFIGCNAKGGGYALASDTNPGAAKCDFEKQYAEVRRLSQQGYIVIATMQHQEIYQHTVASNIRPDFTGFADAGATIVQGSQAHMPQNFEFYGNSLIHYGLGNLFFDQLYELDVNGQPVADKAFIDRHIFYDGRYISTELLTIQFVDLARSRPMTLEERAAFLRLIFTASGW
jgi:poly-gamma-glutamate synthesis protein (capsule biosynthesis protein)